MIQGILDKRLVNLDKGDFTESQLKAAQTYFVKEMTADINQIGANAEEDQENSQRPEQEEEDNPLPAGVNEAEAAKLKDLIFPEEDIKYALKDSDANEGAI